MRGRGLAFMAGRATARNSSANQQVSEPSSGIEELEKLAKMHDSGSLTDEEFSKAKRKLIGK